MFETASQLARIIGVTLGVSTILLVLVVSFEIYRRRYFYLQDCWSEDRIYAYTASSARTVEQPSQASVDDLVALPVAASSRTGIWGSIEHLNVG